jgi:hypothetical protein
MSDDASSAADGGQRTSLEIKAPLAPAYANPYVNISETWVTFEIPLVSGETTTTSPEEVVGVLTNFSDPNLIATLTVWSSYDPILNELTICGVDLVDSDSTYLSTYMQGGQEQTCRQHTYLSDTAPCGQNENWNYCSGITPGLMQEMQATVRSAQETIVKDALAQGLTVIVRTPPPSISADEAHKLLLVYEEGFFKESFDPDKEYGPETVLQAIQSTWYGEIFLQVGENYANVIGSTSDPKISSLAWRRLWEGQFGIATECSSLHYPGGNYPCTKPPPPANNLVGGHVILGTKAEEVQKGSNSVFIIPICAKHNADDNTYMASIVYQQGIAVHNYLE